MTSTPPRIRWWHCTPRLATWLDDTQVETHFLCRGREAEIWYLLDPLDPVFVAKRWIDAPPAVAARQYGFLQAARACGLPVPEAGGCGADQHGQAILVTHYGGVPLTAPSDAQIQAAARILAGIHSTPVHAACGLIPQEDLDALLFRLFPDLRGQEDIAADLLQLRRTIDDRGRDTGLIHGDFHLGNIVVRDDVLTVVDWSDAHRGDRRYDLAWAELLLAVYTGLGASVLFRDAYRASAPNSWDEDALRPFEAMAGLRWLLLARTAPVPIEAEKWHIAQDWVRERMGGASAAASRP